MTDNEKLDLLLSEMQGMKADMQDMKSDMQDMKTDIQGVKADMRDMKSDVKSIKGEIQFLKDEVQALKDDVQTLKTEMHDVKERLSVLETKVMGLNLLLENEIRTNIRRVAEGHLDLSRNLHEAMKIDNEKEMIAIRVGILESEVLKLKERLELNHIA